MQSESKNTMDAIIEDIQDMMVRLHNVTRDQPICIHPTLEAKMEHARQALREAHDEAVRLRSERSPDHGSSPHQEKRTQR